jgi:mRNA interferase RelE/StbE
VAYTIQIKESAQRELEGLQKRDRRLVEQRILSLGENPRPPGVTALQGKRFRGLYRVRAGNFRIVYQTQDDRLVVLIVKIGNRKDVYD